MANDPAMQRVVMVAGWLKLPPGICTSIPAKDIKHYAGLVVRLELDKDLRVYADRDRFVLWVPLSGSERIDDLVREVLSTGAWPE